MRYHVPFAHRKQAAKQRGPVFIGFDEPISIQKRKRPFNWCGFTGMLMALVSPFTLFLIAPLALLFSLFGLRRSPRGMAVWGLVLSLMGTTALSVWSLTAFTHHQRQVARQHHNQVAVENRREIRKTGLVIEKAIEELREFRTEHNHQLPSLDDGMMMTVRYDDAWDKPLRYGTTDWGCNVRSAGPDGEFDTRDDIVLKLDGKPIVSSITDELIGEVPTGKTSLDSPADSTEDMADDSDE